MDLINGRTPDEIRTALILNSDLINDALTLIYRLEAERDAALAKVPKWIGVKDRLPEDNVDVLVRGVGRGNGCKVVAMTSYTHHMHGYNIEGWHSPWDYFHCEYEITHWMPLPEPPEEEAHDA